MAAFSCSSDNENNEVKLGKCFETNRVYMNSESDTLCLLSAQKGWILNNVVVDGVNFNLSTDEERNENNFSWLSIKCTSEAMTIITTENKGQKRDFSLYVTSADGSKQVITGSQSEGDDSEPLDGIWEDCIHMSQEEGVFGADGVTFTINTAEDSYWWFQDIYLFDNYSNLKSNKEDYRYTPGTSAEEHELCHRKDFEKSLEWLSVKRDGQKLNVTLAPNKTGVTRYFNLVLESGDYFGWYRGCQAAE